MRNWSRAALLAAGVLAAWLAAIGIAWAIYAIQFLDLHGK